MKDNCLFKKIYRTSVADLKAMRVEKLKGILRELNLERHELERTINWIEGIIILKEKSDNKQIKE